MRNMNSGSFVSLMRKGLVGKGGFNAMNSLGIQYFSSLWSSGSVWWIVHFTLFKTEILRKYMSFQTVMVMLLFLFIFPLHCLMTLIYRDKKRTKTSHASSPGFNCCFATFCFANKWELLIVIDFSIYCRYSHMYFLRTRMSLISCRLRRFGGQKFCFRL